MQRAADIALEGLTVSERYDYYSRLSVALQQPSAPPVEIERQGGPYGVRTGNGDYGIGGNISPLQYYVSANNVYVFNNVAAPSSNQILPLLAEDASPPPSAFHPNLHFQSCSTAPEGVDFGVNVASRRYKAEKREDYPAHLIFYSQCHSKTQICARTATLNCSAKRTKLAIFLLDVSVLEDNPCARWPPVIRFDKIKRMVHELGPLYEFHRTKVVHDQSSLYLNLLKRTNKPISPATVTAWNELCQWARNNNSSSSSVIHSMQEMIIQLIGIMLGIFGVVAA